MHFPSAERKYIVFVEGETFCKQNGIIAIVGDSVLTAITELRLEMNGVASDRAIRDQPFSTPKSAMA